MQRIQELMGCNDACWTLEHSPIHTIFTPNDYGCFSTVRTFCVAQKITKSIILESLIQKCRSKLEPFSKLILKVIRKLRFLNKKKNLRYSLYASLSLMDLWPPQVENHDQAKKIRVPWVSTLEFKGRYIGSRNLVRHTRFWLSWGVGNNVCLCIQGTMSFIGLGNSDEQRWIGSWVWKCRGWPSCMKSRCICARLEGFRLEFGSGCFNIL